MNIYKELDNFDLSIRNDNKKMRLRLFLILLLLFFYFISFCITGYIIGITANSGYLGQRIYSIILNSGKNTQKPSSQNNKFSIRGKISYSQGKSFKNGTVELRSEPRYTTTDADGFFLFENVEPGYHTISAVVNGVAIASCSVKVEKTSQSADNQIEKLLDGSYLIEIKPKTICINIDLAIDQRAMTVTNVTEVEESGSEPSEGSTDGGTTPPTGIPTDGGTQPSGGGTKPSHGGTKPSDGGTKPSDGGTKPSDGGTKPSGGGTQPSGGGTQPSGGGTQPSGGGTQPSGGDDSEGSAPNIIASDEYKPSQMWTQLSPVDIFAPRLENFGVKKIGGYNVISPGATGKYIFKLENPESFDIEYSIKLEKTDQNNPNLPLQYRIKAGISGSAYIGGSNWKDAGGISVESSVIPTGGATYFTLEWKWDESSDSMDTAIGIQNGNPVYILNIVINAQAT